MKINYLPPALIKLSNFYIYDISHVIQKYSLLKEFYVRKDITDHLH